MRGSRAGIASLALAILVVSLPARGAVVERMSLADLAAEADVVVRGRVLSRASRYDDPPNAARIVTDVTIRVDEAVRGTPAGTVVVTVPGGEVGDRGQAVPGAPRLAVDEDVILFLRAPLPARRAVHRVVGLAQGAFLVLDRNGIRTARQRFDATSFVGPGADSPVPEMRVNDLLDAVRGLPAPAGGR